MKSFVGHCGTLQSIYMRKYKVFYKYIAQNKEHRKSMTIVGGKTVEASNKSSAKSMVYREVRYQDGVLGCEIEQCIQIRKRYHDWEHYE